ncbi:MAG: TorF family putative porin [Thiobacillaceae bacterium]
MKKLAYVLMLAGMVSVSGVVMAEEASPHTVTGNLNFVTDYAFRGISQTDATPAIQGGFDYAHSSGFYLGTWASNVDANFLAGANIEIDVYGGYNWAVTPDVALNVGLLEYYYPSGSLPTATGSDSINTTEAYAGVTWKWINVKYSYSLTDYFGLNANTVGAPLVTGDTDGTGYLEVNASVPLPYDVTLALHYGDTAIKNSSVYDYSDWKIGVTKPILGFNVGVAYVATDVNEISPGVPAYPKHLADDRWILSIGKTF